MTRLDLMPAGQGRVADPRVTDSRGASSTTHADADVDGKTAKGGAFDALLQNLARPTVKGGADDVAENTGRASTGKRTQGDEAAADATTTESVDADAGLDAARLILAGLGAERAPMREAAAEDTGGAEPGQAARAAGDTPGADRKPRTFAVTVVARETHFEPVRRPESLDAALVDAQAGATVAADDATAEPGKANDPGTTSRAGADRLAASATTDDTPHATRATASPVALPPGEPAPTNLDARAPAGQTSAPTSDVAARTTAATLAPTASPQPATGETPAPAARGSATHADADLDTTAVPRTRSSDAGEDQVAAGDDRNAATDERRTVAQAATAAVAGSSETTADPTGAALPQATLQRLAGAILTEARGAAATASQHATGGDEAPTGGGPVRILTLRLQPETLGTVTVRLRLVGASLEMQVRADNSDTAALLERDRGALEEILKSSGYDTDLLTIQSAGDGPRPDSTTTVQAAGRQDASTDGGFRQSGGGQQPSGREAGDGDRPRSQPASTTKAEMHDEAPSGSSRPGGIYL